LSNPEVESSSLSHPIVLFALYFFCNVKVQLKREPHYLDLDPNIIIPVTRNSSNTKYPVEPNVVYMMFCFKEKSVVHVEHFK
jgi:hypothetical protein